MSASRDTPYLPLQSPLIRKAIALSLRKRYILLSSKAMAYFPLQDGKSFGIRQIQVQSSSWPVISSATLDKLLSSSERLHKREEAAETAPVSYDGWGGKDRHTVKPDDAPVNIKLDTKWSHFKETSKAKEPILSRWKSQRDFIQGVNCFLTVISLPTPECSTLPPHTDVSLSRVTHTCRLPTAVPTTWKPHALPSDLLGQGSHSSNAEGSAPDTMKSCPGLLLHWY